VGGYGWYRPNPDDCPGDVSGVGPADEAVIVESGPIWFHFHVLNAASGLYFYFLFTLLGLSIATLFLAVELQVPPASHEQSFS
jgi:membrane protein insertase Oxa1/YidC/SpoIIIJ